MIPDNYEVVQNQNNRLFGVARKDKAGKLNMIVPCLNKSAAVARPYNRIFIAYAPVYSDNNSMTLRNYNGNIQLDSNVFDVKFGKECIYIKTVEPRTGKVAWALLDKDLNILKYLIDFRFTCQTHEVEYYLPNGRERLEVQGANGQIYHLTTKTGELEEYHRYEKKDTTVKQLPAEYYNIIVDTDTNKVRAIAYPGGTEILVNVIGDIGSPIGLKLIGKLLDIECGADIKDGRALYEKVTAKKAELLFSLLRLFKPYEGVINLLLLVNYKISTGGNSDGGLLAEVYKELVNGMNTISADFKDGRKVYYMALYTWKGSFYGFVKDRQSRITNVLARAVPGGGLSSDVLESIDTMGVDGCKFNIGYVGCARIKGEETKVSRGANPRLSVSALNNPTLKGRIAKFTYSTELKLEVELSVNGKACGKQSLLIGDELNYIPKHKSNDKNLVYSGKVNDLFVAVC